MGNNQLYQTLATATRVLNVELKKMIQEVGAVKSGRMKNVSVVSIDWKTDQKKFNISINSTEYYKYVDKGTKHIKPRNITKKLVQRSPVKKQIQKVSKVLVEHWVWKTISNN